MIMTVMNMVRKTPTMPYFSCHIRQMNQAKKETKA